MPSLLLSILAVCAITTNLTTAADDDTKAAPGKSSPPVKAAKEGLRKHVMHVARFLAKVRGADFEAFEQQLDANAERCFGIKA